MNIKIIRGDDKLIELRFSKDNMPLDITGWKIYFTMKKSKADPDEKAILAKDITEHSDPQNGITQLFLTNVETAEFKRGDYFYDIQAKDNEGYIITVLKGKIIVDSDITRRTT